MAACMARILLRKKIIPKLSFSNYFMKHSTAAEFKTIYLSSSIISSRCYSSQSPRNGQENEDTTKKSKDIVMLKTQGLFGWLSKKVHMFLLKAYFDPEFDENEFIRGAKQALVVASEIIAEKRFDDMYKICQPRLIDVIKDASRTQDLGPAVKEADIMMAKIKEIQLDYTEEKTKQIKIDVTFACRPKHLGPVEQVIGNVKIIFVKQPRIVEYRFRKLCVPDEDSWLIDGVGIP